MTPSAALRFAPKPLLVSMGRLFAPAAVIALVLGALADPFFYWVVVMFPLGAGVNLLLAQTGLVAYVHLSPHRVKRRPVFLGMPLNLMVPIADLNPGDSLVVTGDGLFVWRGAGAAYERLAVDPALAHPADWEPLRNWAASIWPQPPDYSHRRAVVE